MVKVYHVDLDSKCVKDPQILRAHQTMTVGEFKRLVEEVSRAFTILIVRLTLYDCICMLRLISKRNVVFVHLG